MARRCGAARALITDRTAVVVASAFNYPYGVMDPVEELAALAAENGAGCHVDACIGSFVLPFLERLGHDIPPWDFRVEGVTAISADVHKYGYVPKGASVVLHRDDDWFGHQAFLYDQWGSGIYGSGAVAGARAAAPIACAWAAINHLGVEGYTDIMRDLMEVAANVRETIESIDGIEIVGDPIGPVLATRSDTIDLFAVGDAMDDRGWHLNRNVGPTRPAPDAVTRARDRCASSCARISATRSAHHGARARRGALLLSPPAIGGPRRRRSRPQPNEHDVIRAGAGHGLALGVHRRLERPGGHHLIVRGIGRDRRPDVGAHPSTFRSASSTPARHSS